MPQRSGVLSIYPGHGVLLAGRKLWEFGLEHTFFGHFCAGQSAQDVTSRALRKSLALYFTGLRAQVDRTVARLKQSGLQAVLDYAAEVPLHAV